MSQQSNPVSLSCDQAVFTSMRSRTGEGYRVIAASGSIRPEERAEITRRSPSHGSLDIECAGMRSPVAPRPAMIPRRSIAPPSGDSNPEAVGLMSYRLASGRHCVSYCCHAGREQTARGGQRVYAHIALVDAASFNQVDCDPIRIHRSLQQRVKRQGPVLDGGAALDPLVLDIAPPSWPSSGAGFEPALSWYLAEQILDGRSLICTAGPSGLQSLHWALLSVPKAVRRRRSMSVGVRFSPTRELDVVLVEGDVSAIAKRVAGRGTTVVDSKAAGEPGPAHAAWFKLLQRWWSEGRSDDIVQLTSNRAAEALPGDLNRIAAECEAEDKAKAEEEAKAKAEEAEAGARTEATTPAGAPPQ
jgi:hypothetical protein